MCGGSYAMLMLARPMNENNANNTTNEWTDSLFNCFSQIVPSCVMSFLCPCVLMGQISEAVHFAPCACVCTGYVALLLTFIIITAYNNTGILVIWALSTMMVCVIRQHVRKYHFMRQKTLEDIAVSCLCSSCALSQMARHIYRYRSMVDECPCSTDGRLSSPNISTVIPVIYGRAAPVYPVSYPTSQQPVVPSQQTHFSYTHYPVQQPASAQTQQYYYDNNGNMIPIAVAVPV